jgi:hypothetical protein
MGYAGDVRPPLTVYVAITSRFLARPVNVSVIAPSAAGKNEVVRTACAFHPEDAVHSFSAASPMSVIYSDADFRHKFVNYAEADSIPDEGRAGSIIRSLAEDSVAVYEVPVMEKGTDTSDGKERQQYRTKRIVKEGPTGLITTSTRSLAPQLSTRMLEISLRDDPQQTRDVMRAHVRRANQTNTDLVDLTPFIAFQDCIAASEHRVFIPYGEALAELVSNATTRMRRDFKQLLMFIKAVAIIYQFQRGRTSDERIVATLEDYALVRWLLGPMFEVAVTDGLTSVIRETVEAILVDETGVSQADLGKRLQQLHGEPLARSTINARVDTAIQRGFLINDEWRAGKPSRLRRGESLPHADTSLPSVEAVQEVCGILESTRAEGPR